LFIPALFIASIGTIYLGITYFCVCIYYHSTNILEYAPILLKFSVNRHVFMKLVSLSKELSPHNFETW
jgi:hypothetical protein